MTCFVFLFLCLTRFVTQACILYVAEDICDNLSCTVIEIFVFSLNCCAISLQSGDTINRSIYFLPRVCTLCAIVKCVILL